MPCGVPRRVLIACSTGGFPQDTLSAALRRIGWAGYAAAEVVLAGASEELPEADVLRARLNAEELEPAALFIGAAPGVSDDLDGWARLGRAAALAAELSTPERGGLVVAHAPPLGEGTREGLVAGLKLLDRALADTPMTLALVNRAGTLLATPEDFAALWQAGASERLAIALDPAQAELAGWDPVRREGLPVPVRHVYWNDIRQRRPAPAGTGDLPLRVLAETLTGDAAPRSLTVLLDGADPWAVEPVAHELLDSVTALFAFE